MSIIYKEVDLDELPQVARLYNLLSYEMKAITNDFYFNYKTLSDKTMLDNLEKAVKESNIKIYVAKKETDIIGFISGTIISCFLPVSSVGEIGYIEAAYVVEYFRGNKIMGSLEEMLVEYFKNCGLEFVELNVLTGNIKGKHFWNKSKYTTFREQMRKQL